MVVGASVVVVDVVAVVAVVAVAVVVVVVPAQPILLTAWYVLCHVFDVVSVLLSAACDLSPQIFVAEL